MSDNVYSDPEAFGLKQIAEIDLTSGYDFDKYVLWIHDDGSFWFGHDAGCSCPAPFENYTRLDYLDRVFNAAEMSKLLQSYQNVSYAEAMKFLETATAGGLANG